MRVAFIALIAVPLLSGCDTLKDFLEWLEPVPTVQIKEVCGPTEEECIK